MAFRMLVLPAPLGPTRAVRTLQGTETSSRDRKPLQETLEITWTRPPLGVRLLPPRHAGDR